MSDAENGKVEAEIKAPVSEPSRVIELDSRMVAPNREQFKTIYADPPWYENGGGKIVRGANAHYQLMKTKDILAMPVYRLAEDNAHLYLWTTNNFLPDALAVMAAWGFQYKTMITWGKARFGIGQYFRGQTEHCLFGVRGCLPYRTKPDGTRAQGRTLLSVSEAWERNRQHSEKPAEMRAMIELVSHPSYLELFARRRVAGWTVWGNQIPEETVSVGNPSDVERGDAYENIPLWESDGQLG